MIWILKIKLLFGANAENDWEATIEIDSTSTLVDLHYAIQDATEFDDDHLFEFYISRTERSHRNRVHFDDENEKIFSTTIESLYPLKKGNGLYYMFDWGDNWLFKITKSRKSPEKPRQGVEYPRLVSEEGIKPEQYPDWEE